MLQINTIKIILNKLEKSCFDFLVIGGLISNAVCKEHSRSIDDIDIVFDDDIKNVEVLFKKEFEVIRFDYFSFSKTATEESFTSIIKINDENILVEGRKLDYYKSIKKQDYQINDFAFKGVPLEFQIAEKIIAMFSIPHPQYKHLIDLYSFSELSESCYSKKIIKEYFDLLISNKNKIKKELALPLLELIITIDPKKEFEGSIYLSSLQAGYNYSKEYIINKVNKWLNSINL